MQSPFEGKLIRLRAWEPEDEPAIFRWINDPEVTEYLHARYPFSHAQERDWLVRTGTPGYGQASFAVETLAGSRLIGSCGLHASSPENRSAVLGIMIGEKDCWDGGYGTDVMRTLCRFGFEQMNLHRIELDVFAPHARARHVYEKIGFKVEGVRREAHYQSGRYFDFVTMGLLEGELSLD
jgi:RimJ/RimL family protein N-acetyltransferase